MSKPTNTVVMNQGLNPLVSYNFMLRVEGVFDLPCKAVHSFKKENEYEYIQEGGLNDYVHIRRKPVSQPFTFTVERYVGTDYYDPLHNGAELILPVILLVTRYQNHFEVTKRAYVFTGCTVMSKEYGELNSEKSGLHTETIVIGYREMMVVTNPVDIGIGNWMNGRKDKDTTTANKFAQTSDINNKKPVQGNWMNKDKSPGSTVNKYARTDNINKLKANRHSWLMERGDKTSIKNIYAKTYRFDYQKPKQGNWMNGRSKNDASIRNKYARIYQYDYQKPRQGNWLDGREENDNSIENRYATTYKSAKKAEQGNWMSDKDSEKSTENLYARTYDRNAEKPVQRKWPTVSSASHSDGDNELQNRK